MEGLGQVVIGAGLEAGDLLLLGAARAVRTTTGTPLPRARAPALVHLEPRAARQSQVEHHRVVWLAVAEVLGIPLPSAAVSTA